ncbi:MFS transporter [Glycomyces buryatensis]|uniref:MFS-type drug efflux transporter P55 n=2 Tax=Glycomyces buryatensis TaxID=2570927 RepID=A0A4S8QGQ7_9ACTN|nr:MFS transporter [Glycomyces buryatensis]
MIDEFDIPVNHLERATPLVTGYLLGYTAGMPLLGRLSDRFGRKVVIYACLVAFTIGSVVSATATELVPLVAGRALQGLAGGALLPVTMALAAGAVLMVTLVDVQLLAQTLHGLDSAGGVPLLMWFLAGLPVGALVGGFLASRFGERVPAVLGFAAAAAAYFWIARAVPDIEPALSLAGAALGITIAPLSSAALRTTPEGSHGTASAVVVVARMMGMLVGVAALTSWSLHRFQASTADLDTPLPFGIPEAEYLELQADYIDALDAALATQYAEVFTAAAVICLAAALVALGIPGRVRARSSSLTRGR